MITIFGPGPQGHRDMRDGTRHFRPLLARHLRRDHSGNRYRPCSLVLRLGNNAEQETFQTFHNPPKQLVKRDETDPWKSIGMAACASLGKVVVKTLQIS
jgi:hypothetical protein